MDFQSIIYRFEDIDGLSRKKVNKTTRIYEESSIHHQIIFYNVVPNTMENIKKNQIAKNFLLIDNVWPRDSN